MNNNITLIFKLNTDGDLRLDLEEINEEYLIDYVDYYTYSMIKTWDDFDTAKKSSIEFLHKIVDNIEGRDYIVDKIKNTINAFIGLIESITSIEELDKRKRIGAGYHSNQELNIVFTNREPDYEYREFALLEKLEYYVYNYLDKQEKEEIKESLINIIMGRKHNQGVIRKENINENINR